MERPQLNMSNQNKKDTRPRASRKLNEPVIETKPVRIGTITAKGVCKRYHAPKNRTDAGRERGDGQKSICPGWAANAVIMERLLAEGLFDKADANAQGKPKKIWNALNGCVFVADSTGQSDPTYNCYRTEVMPGKFLATLKQRRKRTTEEFLSLKEKS